MEKCEHWQTLLWVLKKQYQFAYWIFKWIFQLEVSEILIHSDHELLNFWLLIEFLHILSIELKTLKL